MPPFYHEVCRLFIKTILNSNCQISLLNIRYSKVTHWVILLGQKKICMLIKMQISALAHSSQSITKGLKVQSYPSTLVAGAAVLKMEILYPLGRREWKALAEKRDLNPLPPTKPPNYFKPMLAIFR